jgi:sigma-B regulation protein RsbU (phosphoserine phosphatase)
MPRPLVTPDDRAMAATAPTALAWAVVLAAGCFVIAGVAEALLIRLMSPTELELDWISDGVLSVALGAAIYLWLHLRATRLALTTQERTQLVLQAQLSLAEAMQRRLLPPVPEPADGLEWAAVLVPGVGIGGEFFDGVQPSPGVRLMLIADVSGKGIPAAMALALLRATFRTVATHTACPAAIAERMSATLYDEWRGEPYVTALIVRVDLASRRLTYTNAGHPPGMLRPDRLRRALAVGGPPLGLLSDVAFDEETLDLEPGDLWVFVTDGVSEALDGLDQPWAAAIGDAIAQDRPAHPDAVCRTILALAQNGRGPIDGDDWSDDRTVVVLSVGQETRYVGR